MCVGRVGRYTGPRQCTEQASPLWRAPQGLWGLAGLRGDAPSAARGAGDERAGRPCGARNKGDAARIDQLSAASQALVPGYQAPPPPTGTAARPSRPRVGFWYPRVRLRVAQLGLAARAGHGLHMSGAVPGTGSGEGIKAYEWGRPERASPIASRVRTRGRRCCYMPPRTVATMILPTMATG